MAWRYSAVQNVALFASVLPVIAAWHFADTVDKYPYFLAAGIGAALLMAGHRLTQSLRPRLLRRSAAFVAGEVAPEHAPGGFVMWLAPVLWFVALALFANAYLDPSPQVRHASVVLRHTRPAKGPGHVVLRGFRPGEAEFSIHANSSLVRYVSDGDSVTIVARAGLFRWDRIEAIERIR